MNWQPNFDLKSYNSFGLSSKADHFIAVHSGVELEKALETAPSEIFILGGGSNILLPDTFSKSVLHNKIADVEVVEEEDKAVLVDIGGGMNWHQLVLWSVENNYGGIENLSLIPGSVGAAPVQNIGAYGKELKDVFHSLNAIEIDTGKRKTFQLEDCQFGYRDSYFKGEGKGKFVITAVQLKLTKKDHRLSTSYGAIQTVLLSRNIINPGIRDISNAVIEIRQSKLPDPEEIGNCGSFFKNPILNKTQFEAFMKSHPNAPWYKAGEDLYKIPAGWMIDYCGWKGRSIGPVGCYSKQALVIINHGGAKAKDVHYLVQEIQKSVGDAFGISLEPEVTIL